MALAGKVVLLTGASMGIGAAVARRLAKEGATLALLSRSRDNLNALSDELQGTSSCGPVHCFAVDVQKYASLCDAVAAIVRTVGRPIDILVNNAGLALGAPKLFP